MNSVQSNTAKPAPANARALNVVVVTGAASGMGRVYAERMATAGAQVAALDRDSAALEALAQATAGITPYSCDVTDSAALNAIVQDIELSLGPVDRLVHCAAIMPAGELAQHTAASLGNIMAVNYGGTVNAVAAVLPAMQARNSGQIVLFGSVGGAVPIPECGGYCASKAAVNTYAEILIEETRDSAVQVMLVCPSLVNTPLLQQAAASGDPAMVRYSIAQQRFSAPEDIINAVERGLQRNTEILYPTTEAKIMTWLRRFSPRLVWRLLHASSKLQAPST